MDWTALLEIITAVPVGKDEILWRSTAQEHLLGLTPTALVSITPSVQFSSTITPRFTPTPTRTATRTPTP
jgi:hypothetical protein